MQNYVQGGRILIKHQAVAIRLADMATKLTAVRALLNEATRAVDERSHDAEALCNMAKMFASTEIFHVVQNAMELHGGNGVMLDFGVEKFLRDASLFLHRDATVDISRFKIVKAMFPETAGVTPDPKNKRRSNPMKSALNGTVLCSHCRVVPPRRPRRRGAGIPPNR